MNNEAGDQAGCALEEGTPAFEHLVAGRQVLENGDFARAKAELEEANRLTGGVCYEPLVALARVRLELGLHEEAAEAVLRAERVAPSFGLDPTTTILRIEILLAEAQRRLSQDGEGASELLSEARGLSRRALLFESRIPDGRYYLARSLDLGGELREAWSQYQLYLDRYPQNPHLSRVEARMREIRDLFVASGEPAEIGPGIVPPVPVHRQPPKYPRKLRRRGLDGVVVIRAIVDTSGRVRNARILEGSHPLFDESALEAMREWTFEPARLEESDRPVAVFYTLTVNFELRRD